MKTLAPVTYNQYQCGYCSRIYKTSHGCITHELKCYYNPKRNCGRCSNRGYVERLQFERLNPKKWLKNMLSGKLEVTPVKKEPCDACQIAAKCGGKSYIKI